MTLIQAIEKLKKEGYIDVTAGNDFNNIISIDDYYNNLQGDITENMEVVIDEYNDGTADIIKMENGYRQDRWLVAYK